jgi:transposase-like protein
MSELHTRAIPQPMSIETQRCPRCYERLTLRRIEPEGDGIDRRTYRCSKCHREQTFLLRFHSR